MTSRAQPRPVDPLGWWDDGPRRELAYGSGPDLRTLTASRWTEEAACLTADRDAWFEEHHTSERALAVQICHGCPIRRTCLAWSLVFDEEFGVWGGVNPANRRTLTRRLRAGEPLDHVLDDALDDALDDVLVTTRPDAVGRTSGPEGTPDARPEKVSAKWQPATLPGLDLDTATASTAVAPTRRGTNRGRRGRRAA